MAVNPKLQTSLCKDFFAETRALEIQGCRRDPGAMPVALVTGPTAGIGRAFARRLASEGYSLVLVSRDEQRLQDLASELSADNDVRAEVLVADLADRQALGRVERRLREQPVDVLVNNAGFGLRGPFEANDVEEEQRGLDVLVTAVMRLSHAALEPMLVRGSGEIVNVSSVAGYLPRGTYGAAKAWVTSFSAWANVHYRPRGVRVMALCPGFVRTEFHARMGSDTSGIPPFLWLDADDLVDAALSDLRAGRAVSVPSKRYKTLVAVSRALPRPVLERVVRRDR